MIKDVDTDLALYKEDMQRDFSFRMADVENLLYEMEKRGLEFFDETFRLARVLDLFRKDRIRIEFEKKVVANAPEAIDQKVHELIDWLVESDLRQWQAVKNHLAERQRAYQDRLVGDLGSGNFSYDRERLIDAVGREAQRVVETYDKGAEAQAIAAGAQEAVAASAVLGVGAIGLGALVTALASTVAADVTGILMATFIAALGFVIIPAKRRMAKKEMSEKISALRAQLMSTLDNQFQKEISRSVENIQNAITPYTRFVRAEEGKLNQIRSSFEETQLELSRLKQVIANL